jgi:two-component system chemotaxis sensor kinase CheA
MPNKKGGALLQFLTSGQFENPRDEAVMDVMVRYVIYNVALMVGAAFLISFGFTVILGGDMVRGCLDIILGLVCIIVIFLLRTKVPYIISGLIPLAPFGVLCIMLLLSGGQQGFAGLWVYTYPPIVIFILGLYAGTILSVMVLLGMIAVTLIPGLAGFDYVLPIALRFIAVYILTTVLTVVYEQIRVLKDRWVKQLTQALKTERDEIAAMKDNLPVGMFLMDKNFLIQPSYSEFLGSILDAGELQGKNFVDLLSTSITAKERDILEDYFRMVLNRSFNSRMLTDVNPLVEFTYVHNEKIGIRKVLRSSFAAVDRGGGEYFVLGTLEDITAEKELARQLEEEGSKRESEMQALFQVIQIEPRVFSDFIEDAEYEFDRINEILKNKELSTHDAMVNIFQSVHAIKSNAVILGLENFSGKLHELETKIGALREKEEIPFEDILRITLEMEKIMQEKDKFKGTIDKIQSFNKAIGDSRRQDRYVLVETLTNACKKAADALDKKAALVIEEIDGIVLEKGPRRIIKETLTQLIRNSIYHGIERPEDREALGKERTGNIRVSIKHTSGKIHIRLADDGKGLDYEKIRQKARALKLLKNGEDDQDKGRLSQFIFAPGFSTAQEADVHAGRGIGLNLVLERIRDLQGSIKLQSETGKGTIFHIFLPLEAAATVNKAS